MVENRSKPTETGQAHLSAARELAVWLDREGGNQRIPQVLALLSQNTAAELSEGRQPPAYEVEALAQQHVDRFGGTLGDQVAGRWLRRGEVQKWWAARGPAIEQACRRAGLGFVPVLVIKPGGGRSNSTEYRLDFEPMRDGIELESVEAGIDTPNRGDLTDAIQYQVDPARTALWVRWLSTIPQFHIRSWRGWLLVTALLLALTWVMINWLAVGLSLWPNHPVSSRDLLTIIGAATNTWLVWLILGPLGRPD